MVPCSVFESLHKMSVAGVRVHGQKHIVRPVKQSLYGSSLTSEGKKR